MRAISPQKTNGNELRIFAERGTRFLAVQPAKPLYAQYSGPSSYATVIPLNGHTTVTRDWLCRELDRYRSTDDVFCDAFLTGVILTGASDPPGLTILPDAWQLLESLGNRWTEPFRFEDNGEDIPKPGPYIAFERVLFEVFRLYDDTQGAFMNGVVYHHQKRALELGVGGEHAPSIAVAVPSRLRDAATPSQPLAGLRVAVKDVFQIRGVRTSLCNRAYHKLYPPAKETAACIKLLTQAGANVVGLTKLASFAATEEPIECVDFQAPWNPRADGYQSPAGSSSGSGAAIAAYPWLDIAIGSDTSGSGRRPGHWNGCFAMRPSHGALPVEGYIPSFRRFDVPVFYGRDIEACKDFAHHWYGKDSSIPGLGTRRLPLSIVYPSDYVRAIRNGAQVELIEKFTSDLEASFGVERRTVSFDALWDTSPPAEANSQSLQEYMKYACRNSFFHDDYHNFDQFREDYFKRYAKTPYISPPVHRQWERSAAITSDERDEAVARLEVYRNWFSQEVMRANTHLTIVVIPIEEIAPRYRDDATSDFWPTGVPMLFLSPVLGGPELTVPIGEVPFDSKVTREREYLPVGISLLAMPGWDMELFELAQKCLGNSGRATEVYAGKRMFGEGVARD